MFIERNCRSRTAFLGVRFFERSCNGGCSLRRSVGAGLRFLAFSSEKDSMSCDWGCALVTCSLRRSVRARLLGVAEKGCQLCLIQEEDDQADIEKE
eukprot:scaffold11432_cov94-Amphora_coffeaeformis.AAC.2